MPETAAVKDDGRSNGDCSTDLRAHHVLSNIWNVVGGNKNWGIRNEPEIWFPVTKPPYPNLTGKWKIHAVVNQDGTDIGFSGQGLAMALFSVRAPYRHKACSREPLNFPIIFATVAESIFPCLEREIAASERFSCSRAHRRSLHSTRRTIFFNNPPTKRFLRAESCEPRYMTLQRRDMQLSSAHGPIDSKHVVVQWE